MAIPGKFTAPAVDRLFERIGISPAKAGANLTYKTEESGGLTHTIVEVTGRERKISVTTFEGGITHICHSDLVTSQQSTFHIPTSLSFPKNREGIVTRYDQFAARPIRMEHNDPVVKTMRKIASDIMETATILVKPHLPVVQRPKSTTRNNLI